MDDIWSSSKNITDDETCLRAGFHVFSCRMNSVKPFKSKNRDKFDLDAPNPNLKKGCDRDFLRQPNL